jgi:hypothetical protein
VHGRHDRFFEELLFRCEVLVKQGAVHACGVGDGLDTGARETLDEELSPGHLEYLAASLFRGEPRRLGT